MANNRYDSSRQWYAIHTYSGYEEKVADSIRQRINAVDMADKIFDVMVPKEKQIQIKNGKRKVIEAKIFQGSGVVGIASAAGTMTSSYVVRTAVDERLSALSMAILSEASDKLRLLDTNGRVDVAVYPYASDPEEIRQLAEVFLPCYAQGYQLVFIEYAENHFTFVSAW